jgi:hypothetical protein
VLSRIDISAIRWINFSREMASADLAGPISNGKRHQRISLDQFLTGNDISASRWTNFSRETTSAHLAGAIPYGKRHQRNSLDQFLTGKVYSNLNQSKSA